MIFRRARKAREDLKMLPDFETCSKHLRAYKKRAWAPKPGNITFPQFWEFKTGIENSGQNILDAKNISDTARLLRGFLDYLRMGISGVSGASELEEILRSIQPYYNQICQFQLGSGQIQTCRSQIELIYENLKNKEVVESKGRKSSIVGKSAILMAVWGQVPRFDSISRKRFERWTHSPAPAKLPNLKPAEMWYTPGEFGEIIEELDRWVAAWPKSNEGKSFIDCFYNLCPGIPPGRQIDLIYHWPLPDPWVDYRTWGS
jgi:hypothetical protein